jgi:iron(III) transport system substrate-binding protein
MKPSWLLSALLAVAVLAAAVSPLVAADEVVVYSARHYGQEPAFDAFTKQTGIAVKMLTGSTGEIFERLKAEGDRSPADILLTVDAGNLWNAARAGLLSPVTSTTLAANVPAHLRDPENKWFGLTVRARTIVYNAKKVQPSELSTYEALGEPKWKDRLCLRTSGYIYNQSLVATFIKRHGEPRTEAILKGWVAITSRASSRRIPASRSASSGRTSRRTAPTSTSPAPGSPRTRATARAPSASSSSCRRSRRSRCSPARAWNSR